MRNVDFALLGNCTIPSWSVLCIIHITFELGAREYPYPRDKEEIALVSY